MTPSPDELIARHPLLCAQPLIGHRSPARPTTLGYVATRRVCSSSGVYGVLDCGGRWVLIGRGPRGGLEGGLQTRQVGCNGCRRQAICQWSRSKVWGRRAHPIHPRCRREQNGAACQKMRRLQEGEIGQDEWHVEAATSLVWRTLRQSLSSRSPDSVWGEGISASTSRTPPPCPPAGRCQKTAGSLPIGTTHLDAPRLHLDCTSTMPAFHVWDEARTLCRSRLSTPTAAPLPQSKFSSNRGRQPNVV